MTKWLELIAKLAPVLLVLAPGGAVLAPLVPVIIHAIQEAEQLKDADGADKKAHVQNIVADGVAVTNAAAGKTLLDPKAVLAISDGAIDTVVDVANLIYGLHQEAGSEMNG